jgi:hypothetical protein
MITLPTEKSTVENYNPRLMLIFGSPKSGKSSLMASLDNNLIIDLEDGYRALPVMKVQARSANDLFEIRKAILTKGKEIKKKPYRFITIDNATRLEEMALTYAVQLYQQTPMGANWGWLKDKGMFVKDANGNKVIDPKADVRQLPNGQGWGILRQAVKQMIEMFIPLCDSLILVCHVKDKQIQKNEVEMTQMEIDLSGKLSAIISGQADAIGYVYREGTKTYISFEGGDNIIREARSPHLRNKKFMIADSSKGDPKFNASQLFV